MARIEVKQINDKKEWEDFLKRHEEANFLQSWEWGEFHKRMGKKVERNGFYRGKQLAGVMLSIVEDARRARYLTVPGGPIIDWNDQELVDAAFAEMKRIAGKTKSVFIRIRPQVVDKPPLTPPYQGENSSFVLGSSSRGFFPREIFRKQRCVDSPMHLHAELSNILDITKSEDEILAKMRKTTRYEIKKAQKLGIKIEASKDEKTIRAFYDLQIETAKRQKFVPFSFRFFEEQFRVFFEEDKALLYTASFEGRVLAQAFIIFYGTEAAYHYGASTDEGRKYPGAYLLLWEAIREAKRRGMKRFNFWGVAPETDKDHRFYGLSLFKRGFGGEDVAYLHAQDLVIDNFRYKINYFIESFRKKLRRV